MPLEIVRDDITRMKVDAIVNAANTSLLGGGGVDGAIHAAAGPELLEACRQLGGCPTGQARITGGFRLPARYVIHTPGPIWMGGHRGERQLLASCYRNSLALAAEHECESIAFPMISTGAYGYPKDEALRVALDEITAFLMQNEMTVYIVTFGKEMFETTEKLFSSVRAYIDDARAAESEKKFSRNRLFSASVSAPAFPMAQEDADACALPDQEACSSFRTNQAVLREEKASASRSGIRKLFRKRISRSEKAELEEPEKTLAGESASPEALVLSAPKAVSPEELKRYLEAQDIGFSEMLLRLINEKGMTDVECYKQANIDRKLFNHIKNARDYKPAKKTALAFAVALRLSPSEAEDLLRRAGYSLSSSNTMDLAIRYFLENGFYNIHDINIMLYDLDLPLLGA